MEVRRNGRLTTHVVRCAVHGLKPMLTLVGENVTPDGVKITYQYSWSDGAWHVVEIYVTGRNPSGGRDSFLIIDVTSLPDALNKIINSERPVPLANAEAVK